MLLDYISVPAIRNSILEAIIRKDDLASFMELYGRLGIKVKNSTLTFNLYKHRAGNIFQKCDELGLLADSARYRIFVTNFEEISTQSQHDKVFWTMQLLPLHRLQAMVTKYYKKIHSCEFSDAFVLFLLDYKPDLVLTKTIPFGVSLHTAAILAPSLSKPASFWQYFVRILELCDCLSSRHRSGFNPHNERIAKILESTPPSFACPSTCLRQITDHPYIKNKATPSWLEKINTKA